MNVLSLCIVMLQEIKFEPNVMCEHIDKKLTFRSSQVWETFRYKLYLGLFIKDDYQFHAFFML
jgi:hypothetical protein